MQWFIHVLKQYATFSGRARRAEYWWFVLFYLVALVALTVVDRALGFWSADAGMGLLTGLFILGTLLPYLAVTTRRLHDRDKSGWWQLLNFVPLIGPLVLLVWMVRAGNTGSNSYGADPKA
ncbi:DUF805 domain-containing protein [Hydrogenophaga sp. IBVHS2]|uniref:DUF805 domain-containing protein n=1 Tax=Hydrogenophaga sp. IBVHS2 TaxID=1985170 RepID=UPI000A2E20E4|nr:DUF805 domain-containing protein [Hydrogenophaga sp. IBVHS2]OSZ65814.1 hypothetical protein CAP38_07140 [Hydrogenophaga sp. IBVHS2]